MFRVIVNIINFYLKTLKFNYAPKVFILIILIIRL